MGVSARRMPRSSRGAAMPAYNARERQRGPRGILAKAPELFKSHGRRVVAMYGANAMIPARQHMLATVSLAIAQRECKHAQERAAMNGRPV